MSPQTADQPTPADPEFRAYERTGTVLAETPDGEQIHGNQLIVVEQNRFTQLHYYAVEHTEYDDGRDGIRVREAGSHDFERVFPLAWLSDADVEVVTCEDGTPVWGY